jgi:hypothetical protein
MFPSKTTIFRRIFIIEFGNYHYNVTNIKLEIIFFCLVQTFVLKPIKSYLNYLQLFGWCLVQTLILKPYYRYRHLFHTLLRSQFSHFPMRCHMTYLTGKTLHKLRHNQNHSPIRRYICLCNWERVDKNQLVRVSYFFTTLESKFPGIPDYPTITGFYSVLK